MRKGSTGGFVRAGQVLPRILGRLDGTAQMGVKGRLESARSSPNSAGKLPPYVRLNISLIDSGTWAALSNRARLVLPVVLRHMDNVTRETFVGIRKLQKVSGLGSPRTVSAALKDLDSAGVLDFAPHKRGGRRIIKLSRRYLKSGSA